MQKIISLFSIACLVVIGYLFFSSNSEQHSLKSILSAKENTSEKNDDDDRNMFNRLRLKYEFDMIKDGGTGILPPGIQEKERQLALRIPRKDFSNNLFLSPFADNSYAAAGPANFGGRTRVVLFDKRFGSNGNQVILAGAVSGGIFRSTDGGEHWTLVTPEREIHNVTTMAQDPRPGFENTWYAGGGEAIGNSASTPGGGAFYNGYGLMKSTDNGATWQRIQSTFTGQLEVFDSPYDYVHKILVNPINGDVYVAAHRRIMRSTDGENFQEVFAGTQPAAADNGQLDIVCTNSGRLYLAVNGGFPDKDRRGVWFSDSGNQGSWTRFAGGQTIGTDSIPGWRANGYNASGSLSTTSKRILLALAPSNNNLIFVLYENGFQQDGINGRPEVDLFKFDFVNSTFTNLSANMPDFNGQLDGVDPIETQDGFDMMIAIKPDNPDVIFIGGTNLYRSTNGFTNISGTSWIGGYKYWGPSATSFPIVLYPNCHPDIHALVFDPTNPNRVLCGTDGGVHHTTNILSNTNVNEPVTWRTLPNYQTAQYYHVNLEQHTGGNQVNNFIGGMQDNGAYVRLDGDNDHIRRGGGDGGAAAINTITNNGFLFYTTSHLGKLDRHKSGSANEIVDITPTGLTDNPDGGFGEFVTYFKMDADNPDLLYYVNFNRVFRTLNASSVSSSSGWTELTGIANAVNPGNPGGDEISVRTIELSRNAYSRDHVMYIGTTKGKIFRLNNPRDTLSNTAPVDITPPLITTFNNNGASVICTDIAVNPKNDEEVLAVYSNYQVTIQGNTRTDFNIWWTNNAKSPTPTWKLIEGNLTLHSVRSCAIISKKDNAGAAFTEYYVGTATGLYSILNIADTLAANKPIVWKREGGNVLNLAVINSLAYRPYDNTLLIGTHGNGMFYTQIPNANFGEGNNGGDIFIRYSYPGLATTNIFYKVGNMSGINKLTVKIYGINGQLEYKTETGYFDGDVDIRKLSRGIYILYITDGSRRFVKKFVKG